MKKQGFSLIVFLSVVFISCGSSNQGNSNLQEYNQILEEIEDWEFEIENEWANPTQYSRVNLLGNPNRIKFENDSVKVFLPFFGERYAGGGYNNDGGVIKYEGIPKELHIQENPEEGTVDISFEGNRNTESLDFLITIYSNGVARTSVTSSQREKIRYDGKLISRE